MIAIPSGMVVRRYEMHDSEESGSEKNGSDDYYDAPKEEEEEEVQMANHARSVDEFLGEFLM